MHEYFSLTKEEAEQGQASFREFLLVLAHPEEVLSDPTLSVQEKREVLADWASDAHAVAGVPSLRQVQSGALVQLDDILDALKSLDRSVDGHERPSFWRLPLTNRGRSARLLKLLVSSNNDSDDDPPPCPALAALPGEQLSAA